MYRLNSRAIILCLFLAMPVVAWCQSTLPDIDLTNNGLYLRSMQEKSWVPIGPNQDVPMGRCGCLLAAAATISGFVSNLIPLQGNNFALAAPWDINDPFLDGSFSPKYEDDFLFEPNTIIPFIAATNGWGYKKFDRGTCGVLFYPWALAREANPFILTNGTGGFTIGPSGLVWQVHMGWDSIARLIVDQNLLQGLPTVVAIDKTTSGGSPLGRHVQLIVGWNSKYQQYRIVDPIDPPGNPSYLPGGDIKNTYAGWEQQIVGIMNFQPGDYGGNFTYLDLVDDPSPVRFLVIAPDGHRTGFDPVTQNFVYEVSNASYGELGAWADPLGQIPPGPPASFLSLAGASGGTYRFEVYGTANGAATYSFDTVQLGSRTTLQNVSDVIAAGEVRKYEVQYVPGGTTTVKQVANFIPQAIVGNAIGTTPGTSVQLNGSRSFSTDGNIVSYQWDFGDGTAGTGSQLSHTYSAPGIYSATLTVTDDQGNTSSAIEQVGVYSPLPTATVQLVSVTNDGALPNNDSAVTSLGISADGRYVLFDSIASNFYPNESSNGDDLFVRDTAAGTTETESLNLQGGPSDALARQFGGYTPGGITADGTRVVFTSTATDLASNCLVGSACAAWDAAITLQPFSTPPALYIRDRQRQTTQWVAPFGGGDWHISSDGRYIAFEAGQIYVWDTQTGTNELISMALTGGPTQTVVYSPRISANGRFVLFGGQIPNGGADDLVTSSPPNNPCGEFYLRDRQNGTTEIVSLTNGGIPVVASFCTVFNGTDVSSDGRFIVFSAPNFNPFSPSGGYSAIGSNDNGPGVFTYVRDRLNRTTRNADLPVNPPACQAVFGRCAGSQGGSLSADGRYLAFVSGFPLVAGPILGNEEVYRRDFTTDELIWVSAPMSGQQPVFVPPPIRTPTRSAISADGQSIAFVPETSGARFPDYSKVFKWSLAGSGLKPVANLSGPYLGWASSNTVPTFVQVDGSQSFDPQGRPLTATWDFGDGSPSQAASGAGQVQHSYSAPGTYTLKLVVNNGVVDSDPGTTVVTIFPALHADSAVATPSCADPGTPVQISGVVSSDNPATQGGWNLAQGALIPAPVQVQDFSATRTVAPSLNNFFFAFTTTVPAQASGAYQLGLAQGPTATVNVPCLTPTDVPPHANAGGPYTNGIGQSITFDGSQSSDSQNRPLTYRWSFGDGAQGTGVNPQHSYTHQGTYVVRLVVNNGVMSSTSVFGGPSFAKIAILADTIPPTTTAVLSPLPNANGWNNSNVTITLNSADNETNGTGVKQITYSASGAQTITSTVVAASSASFTINTEGITTITFFGTDNAGNVEAANTLSIKLDKTPPSINCGAADGVWHATDVSIVCSASDVVSGLANSSDASFSLSTNVPAGTETSNAATGTRPVCDVAGNCATAGPVTGNMVDKKPPSINVSSPASGGSYLLNQAVNASYTCADGGSGVASCTGTVASGSAIDSASVGSKTFTVNATDKVGNGAAPQTVSYSVIYGLCILYDTTRAVQSGSTIPLKIQLCDANNVDVSSSAIVVHGVSLVQVSTNASEVLQASGNANPDNDFRFDSTLGPTGGYIFNLSTKGLTTGSYLLTFTAGLDPSPRTLMFQVR